MSINLATFETALQAKLNGLDSTNDVEDFVLLTKSVEDIDIAKTTSYASVGDLPDAGDHEGRIVYVSGTDKVYYSDGVSWVTFATSQNPDFTIGLQSDDSVGSENYDLITASVTTTQDYGAVTGSTTTTEDYGFGVSTDGAGTQGDIYIDPNDWTFTIYDGETREGIKHLRADGNNINYRTKSAANQGIAHLVKNTDTTTANGGLITVPFDETRLNDTRMGYLDSDGNYYVYYDGWYEILVDGHVASACWVGFSNISDYSTVSGQTSQGPDEYSMQYINEQGNFQMKRMLYIPTSGSLALSLVGATPGTSATIRGSSNWVGGNVNTAWKYLTQMTIKFLGDNTVTNSYQVSQ